MISIVCRSPGRVELLGNHTDYNEGFVLSFAVEQGVTVSGVKRDDNQIILRALDLGATAEASTANLAPLPNAAWANYCLGVADSFRELGATLSGFDISITSDLPMGAGLSSSAALECATARFLQHILGTSHDLTTLARIGQRAEHLYAGVKCGLLDQITSLYGHEGSIVHTDFRSVSVELLPAPGDAAFVIVNSGVKHALVSGEYNERRESCHGAAAALGLSALRDATTSMLHSAKNRLSETQYRRALHVVGENERVILARQALEKSDATTLGQLMSESHHSSRDYFENSCPELDLLTEWALATQGCLGARLTGGGFGGATINLVQASHLDSFVSEMQRRFEQHFSQKAGILITRCSGNS